MRYSKELQNQDSVFSKCTALTKSYALFSLRRQIKNHPLKSISSQRLIVHPAKELLTFVSEHSIYPPNFHPTQSNKPLTALTKLKKPLQPIEFTNFYQEFIFRIRTSLRHCSVLKPYSIGAKKCH